MNYFRKPGAGMPRADIPATRIGRARTAFSPSAACGLALGQRYKPRAAEGSLPFPPPRLAVDFQAQFLPLVGVEDEAVHHLVIGVRAVLDRFLGVRVERVEGRIVVVG